MLKAFQSIQRVFFSFRFLFTDYNRLSSVGGETSLAEMIATLSDACEREFGFLATRLFRVFKTEDTQGFYYLNDISDYTIWMHCYYGFCFSHYKVVLETVVVMQKFIQKGRLSFRCFAEKNALFSLLTLILLIPKGISCEIQLSYVTIGMCVYIASS